MTRTSKLTGTAALAVVAVLALAGCADKPSEAVTQAPTAEQSQAAGDTGGQQAAPSDGPGGDMRVNRTPAVSGEIAAVSGQVAQVQDSSSQTAVTFDASTTVTERVVATAADVTTGVCVSAISAEDGGEATSVSISQPVDGQCSMDGMGMAGGPMVNFQRADGATPPAGGTMPTDMPTDMPSGMPTDMPSGAPQGNGPAGATFSRGFTAGLVTAVDGTTVTVEQNAVGDAEATTKTFTIGETTALTKAADADTTAVTTGKCVTAMGSYDDKGGLTATTLVLSDKGEEGCGGGMQFNSSGGQGPSTTQNGGTSSNG